MIEITLIRLLVYTVTAMLAIVLIIPVYVRVNKPQRCRGGTSEILTTSFSVSRYFDHIEEEVLKIREEQEKESDYTIILWWAFDGLKLNKDGSTEWITRRKKPEPKKEVPIWADESGQYVNLPGKFYGVLGGPVNVATQMANTTDTVTNTLGMENAINAHNNYAESRAIQSMCQAPKATLDSIMEQNTRNSVNTMVAIDSVLAQNMANTIDVQFRQMRQNICQGMQGVYYRSRYPQYPYISQYPYQYPHMDMWKL